MMDELPGQIGLIAVTVWLVGRELVTETSSKELPQLTVAIVHLKIAVSLIPVKPEVGLDGSLMVAVPEVFVHVPVPDVAVFPANVADEAHTVWSEPAAAIVGFAPLMVTVAVEDNVIGQVLLVNNGSPSTIQSPFSIFINVPLWSPPAMSVTVDPVPFSYV